MSAGRPSVHFEFVARRLLVKLRGWLRPELALQQVRDTLAFSEPYQSTLLCVARPADGLEDGQRAQLQALATELGGQVDPLSPAAVLAAFEHPVAALEAAMRLQNVGRTRHSIALITGRCLRADFRVHGRDWTALAGSPVMQVEELVTRVAPASVHVSPETFPLLEAHFDQGLSSGLLTAEYEDEVVREATITMAPRPLADSSTFAGLGWSCA
jgi:hypothetical protein